MDKLKKPSFPLNGNAESLKEEVPARKALWVQLAGLVPSSRMGDVTLRERGPLAAPRPPLSVP